MNEYIGKICPFCKTVIKENDDIVICSDCAMPHHKSCWITNEGCTTFGCTGTIQNAGGAANNEQLDEAATQAEETKEPFQAVKKFCTKCGNRFSEGDLFCGTCGAPLKAEPVTATAKNHSAVKAVYSEPRNDSGYKKSAYRKDVLIEPDNDDYYNSIDACYDKEYNNPSGNIIFNNQNDIRLAYIEKNKYYYQRKFNVMEQSNTSASWNRCAFFFTSYWLFYRKLYVLGAGVLAADFVLYIINGWFTSLLTFGISIAFGILGNSIYKNRIDKLVSESQYFSEEGKKQHVADNRGVNVTATILAIIGYAILVTLFRFLPFTPI